MVPITSLDDDTLFSIFSFLINDKASLRAITLTNPIFVRSARRVTFQVVRLRGQFRDPLPTEDPANPLQVEGVDTINCFKFLRSITQNPDLANYAKFVVLDCLWCQRSKVEPALKHALCRLNNIRELIVVIYTKHDRFDKLQCRLELWLQGLSAVRVKSIIIKTKDWGDGNSLLFPLAFTIPDIESIALHPSSHQNGGVFGTYGGFDPWPQTFQSSITRLDLSMFNTTASVLSSIAKHAPRLEKLTFTIGRPRPDGDGPFFNGTLEPLKDTLRELVILESFGTSCSDTFVGFARFSKLEKLRVPSRLWFPPLSPADTNVKHRSGIAYRSLPPTLKYLHVDLDNFFGARYLWPDKDNPLSIQAYDWIIQIAKMRGDLFPYLKNIRVAETLCEQENLNVNFYRELPWTHPDEVKEILDAYGVGVEVSLRSNRRSHYIDPTGHRFDFYLSH